MRNSMNNYRQYAAIGVGALFLAGMFIFFPRKKVSLNDPLKMSESRGAQSSTSARRPRGATGTRAEKPIIVEQGELSEKELREFAALFEPIIKSRKVAEIFQSGQSMLCDVYEGPDGSLGLTFLTVSSHANEKDSPAIMIQQKTIELQKNGGLNEVTAPSMIINDYQSGKISIGGADGFNYSLSLEGFHLGKDMIQVMAEFKGTPNIQP